MKTIYAFVLHRRGKLLIKPNKAIRSSPLGLDRQTIPDVSGGAN
ncbi:MAG: hypothetical protein ACQEXQ_08820 [Bacillota bacterium]